MSSGEMVEAGEAGLRPVVGCVGNTTVIPWESIARLSEPNESPRWEEARSYLFIELCRGETGFSKPSKSGFSKRRAEVAMASIQSLVIGR